jgi:hypothetical protein
LLVGRAGVGPLDELCAVGGGEVQYVDGLAARSVDQADAAAVGVGQPELLTGAVGIGRLDEPGPICGGLEVQDLATVPGLQPVVAATRVDELPLLPGAVVARPLHDRGAVVRGQVVHVQRLAAVLVDQDVGGVGVHGGCNRGLWSGHRCGNEHHGGGEQGGHTLHSDSHSSTNVASERPWASAIACR